MNILSIYIILVVERVISLLSELEASSMKYVQLLKKPKNFKIMTTNIYTKLHQIQSKFKHLTKTQENKFQKYKYATEYQILKILKPLLNEQKLILTFSDEITPTKIVENSISYDDENLTNLSFKKE